VAQRRSVRRLLHSRAGSRIPQRRVRSARVIVSQNAPRAFISRGAA
jgi:hypothetical protein